MPGKRSSVETVMLDIPSWLQISGLGGTVGFVLRSRVALLVVGLLATRYRSAEEVARLIEATRHRQPIDVPEQRAPDEKPPRTASG